MRKIIASILFLGICTGVFAQAVPFLNIPSDARTAAMAADVPTIDFPEEDEKYHASRRYGYV